MQIWIHDSKMRKITALNNDIPDMLSYSNSAWHPYLDQATSTFDFTIPKFSNGELHEDIKLINDECFVSFYVNGSYQVFYIATLQEDDFNIQLTCNNTNLEYALEYANPFNSSSAQSIEWYLNHMDLLSFAAVEIGINEVSDRKRTLTFDSQETKMNRLQSLMSNFDAEFEFKTELNRDGTYKRIAINIYRKDGIGTDRKDVVLYYSNGLKGVQVTSDKTQMFNAGVFTGKDGLSLADVEISEKNADGIEEFYSRKGNPCLYAPLAMSRYPATMKPDEQDNWIRKDFTTEYENVNDLKAYALRTLKQYAYPLVTYTASVQSGFVSQYTDFKLGDTIRIIDKNFAGGLALEARVSEMVISFDNPTNNSFVFTNYRKFDNKPTSALQTRIDQAIESKLPYRIELATTGGVTFKNNEGETTVKPSLYKGNLPYTTDVTWRWALDGVVTVGMQYRVQAKDITDTAVLTVSGYVGNTEVATTEITLTNVNDGVKGPQGEQGPQGPKGADGRTPYLHIAYANSADGRTDFSTSNTDNKRYLGTYTDYTQADSTDPSKYKWVDMVGTVKGGSRNYFKNSLTRTFYTTDDQTFDYRTFIVDAFWENKDRFKKDFVKISFDITFPVALEKDYAANIHFSATPWYSNRVTFKAGTTSRQHFEFGINLSGASEDYYTNNVFIRFGTDYGFPSGFKIILENMMLSIGSYYPDYIQAIEDAQEQIDSKADQTLTQDQLNALAEKNNLIKAEMEAKASIDTVDKWITAYENYVKANDADKAKSEQALKEASERILGMRYEVNDLKFAWDAIDRFMSFQNEGLIIGKKDGSAYAKFSDDRISLFSGSSEVMYISQGTLNIANGIFTKTIQIGRFRFETHPADADMLVLRYLGG